MSTWTTRLLFAVTIFLGSFLLFASEPIQGKILLPLLGGAPAVWNTCLLFFQGTLLLSYLYAHLLSTKLSPKAQAIAHTLVLALPLLLLPVKIPAGLLGSNWLQEAPVTWLLLALTASIGPAFFAIAATSPLMQSWFVRLGRKESPYTLYAASNLGSLLALLCYPFVIEPEIATQAQTEIWTGLYALLGVMCAAIGWVVYAYTRKSKTEALPLLDLDADDEADAAIAFTKSARAERLGAEDPLDLDAWTSGATSAALAGWREPLRWIALAAAPSSLMLGVTTFLTTDIAAIPLLWMLPLALYTLSFVLVFARYDERSDRLFARLVPLATATLLLLIFTEYRANLWIIVTAHLASFFVLAMACHGRLALAKPAPDKLTGYYFYMALGGVAGGAFNTLLAPEIFSRIAEYPLGVALAAWLCYACRPDVQRSPNSWRWAGVALAAGAGLMLITMKLYDAGAFTPVATWLADRYPEDAVLAGLVYGIPAALVLVLAVMVRRGIPAAPAAALGFAVVALFVDLSTNVLHQSRSFFGVLSVKSYSEGQNHSLVHGGILHGEQWQATEEDRLEPRSYYHREGPLGQIIKTLDERVFFPRIAAIGLGAGTLAAYGHKENAITFYELNPHVEEIARDGRLFTYLEDCQRRWCNVNVVIGDGRLKIAEATDFYDLIVVDAFSSDAIPIHLVTLEALRIYFSKITASGIVAFHISNRYVDLEPVLLNLAKETGAGYAIRKDEGNDAIGKGSSTWVILAAKEGLFEAIAVNDDRWTGLEEKRGVGVWRDDFANVARAFIWR